MQGYELKRRDSELKEVVAALNGDLRAIGHHLHIMQTVAQRSPSIPATKEEARATGNRLRSEAQIVADELREYVDAVWHSGQRRITNLHEEHPKLFKRLERLLKLTNAHVTTTIFGGLIKGHFSGAAPEVYAVALFIKFSKLTDELGSDVILRCDRCERYFVNRYGHRNKRYCSRHCAVAETVKRSRDGAKADKLARAAKLLGEFRAQKAEGDWKAWVDDHSVRKGRPAPKKYKVSDPYWISRNWLTHQITMGLLTRDGMLTEQGKKLIRGKGSYRRKS